MQALVHRGVDVSSLKSQTSMSFWKKMLLVFVFLLLNAAAARLLLPETQTETAHGARSNKWEQVHAAEPLEINEGIVEEL